MPLTDSPAGTRQARNVLFIMCDQLRADYLSLYGGRIPTPNLERLARRGVRFDRAYVNSAVCGPSRTSYYTGRYPVSHRVTWNRVPLPLDERTLGDYLGEAGLPLRLLGKTHFVPDRAGLAAAQLRPEAARRMLLDEGGSEDAEGRFASGWLLRNAALPARVRAEDSETAYLTQRAIDFVKTQGDAPWALHLSYIKPHWPLKAPAPYHAMYGPDDCDPPIRHASERDNPHPVLGAYQRLEESVSFARDEVWRTARPVVMGLVRQIDDELGRLFDHLEQSGHMEDTLILFTSDHGDLAGDHWLGEKEYFYESAIRVPCIVVDPSAAADATRGTVSQQFVECIDIVPTILEALALDPRNHRVEGRSLLALTRNTPTAQDWRDCVFGQLDYAYREARTFLGRGPDECQGWMVRDARYKYIHWEGYPAQLFDLQEDPQEFDDRGTDPALQAVRAAMHQRLFDWLSLRKHRTTETLAQVEARTHAHERMMGIQIGKW